jgi:hypothetical protein
MSLWYAWAMERDAMADHKMVVGVSIRRSGDSYCGKASEARQSRTVRSQRSECDL